jgi:hypothetical protein
MSVSLDLNKFCDRRRRLQSTNSNNARTLGKPFAAVSAVLNDSNVAAFAERIAQQRPRIVSINISLLTNHTNGLEALLRLVQCHPELTDIRLFGSDQTQTTTALSSVVKRFVQAIDKNPNIERLALYNVQFDAEDIAKLLRATTTLSHLSLTSCHLSGSKEDFSTSVKALQQAFRENTSIERLNLILLEDRLLVPLLETMLNHTALRALDVSYGTTAAAAAVAQIIASPKTPFLRHVIVRNSSLLTFEPIIRSLRNNRNVRKLELVKCDIDAVSAGLLKTLFRSPKQQIESLNLVDLDLEEDTNLEDILSGLAHSQNTLRDLTIQGVNIGDQDLRALAMFMCAQDESSQLRVDLDRDVIHALKPFMAGRPVDPRRIQDVLVKMTSWRQRYTVKGPRQANTI